MTRCENCGKPLHDDQKYCSHKCADAYFHKSEKERLFCDWLCIEGIDYSAMMSGEQMQLRKDYNDWLIDNDYKLDLRVNPGVWTKKRSDEKTASLYFRAKAYAVQAKGTEYELVACKSYQRVCNMVGVTNSLRSAS